MAKHACRCKTPECEECPEWIFTFADLVMLMMGFFVILWVLKPPAGKPQQGSADSDKWLDTVAQIRGAFGNLPDPSSKDPVDIHAMMKKLQTVEPLKGKGKGGETTEPRQAPDGTDPLVMNVRPGQHVSVGGRLAFAPGSSELEPKTTHVLDEIAHLIRGYRNIFQVKGHASLDDMSDGGTPQRLMDLSLRRAQVCADYLIAHGISPDTIRVQGCSTYEPIVQRTYTPGAQAPNRRVEVEGTDQLVPDRQDPAPPAQPVNAER